MLALATSTVDLWLVLYCLLLAVSLFCLACAVRGTVTADQHGRPMNFLALGMFFFVLVWFIVYMRQLL